jgi:ribonuclease HI
MTAKAQSRHNKDEVRSPSSKCTLSLPLHHEPELNLLAKDGFRYTSAGFVVVYTDGSCLDNGGKNPKGAIGVYFAPDSPYNLSQPLSRCSRVSNNAAEINAATAAVKICKSLNELYLEIRTDSKFLLGCVLKHLAVWKINGWKKTNRKSVENRPELEELDKALKGTTIRWVYVPAHNDEGGNDRADFLARYATFKMMRENNPFYVQP